jgi:hypothetical protein
MNLCHFGEGFLLVAVVCKGMEAWVSRGIWTWVNRGIWKWVCRDKGMGI